HPAGAGAGPGEGAPPGLPAHHHGGGLLRRVRLFPPAPGGGPGGHRGMESIIAELETEEIPRLRIGIGREGFEGELTAYVLGRFTSEELEIIEQVLDRAVEAIDLFYEEGIDQMMNEVNRVARA
ncbi:MAG: hypothetical protein ACE5KR_01960, partial [Candidatus Bipolaricaulia bacterium]